MKHSLKWHAPFPLWPLALADGGIAPVRFERPLILRFAGDDFMARLQQTLATDPSRLADHAVRHETWKTPAPEQVGWQSLAQENTESPPKLYQPAHNRFYIVLSSFVCQTHGLPDRLLDPAQQDRASCVVRKLVAKPGQTLDPQSPATYDEHGWFGDRQSGFWAKVANPNSDAPVGEERLPMFPLTFTTDGRKRRVLGAIVPAASREVYEGGTPPPPLEATGDDPSVDPRYARFSGEIASGLRRLSDTSTYELGEARNELAFLLVSLRTFLDETWPSGVPSSVTSVLDDFEINGHSWTGLLNNANAPQRRATLLIGEIPTGLTTHTLSLAQIQAGARAIYGFGATDFEDQPLPSAVRDALGTDPRASVFEQLLTVHIAPLTDATLEISPAAARDVMLAALLELTRFMTRELPEVWAALVASSSAGLTSAQRAVYDFMNAQTVGPSSWRDIFVDAELRRGDIETGDTRNVLLVRNDTTRQQIRSFAVALMAEGATTFRGRVNAALSADPFTEPPPLTTTPDTYYVIRCVHERPQCRPYHPPVVSRATRPFRLAAFFDPDAPIRPIRIRMPVDTTPEGLGKFPKGVTMLISDELRKQMARAEQAGLENLMSGSLPGGTLQLGVICSFSIPIITICALILLMIIVQLLNIVFWWLPLFRICLPLNLKAR